MADFTQIQTIAFLQASPQAPDKFFQDKLNDSGKVKSKALGCPRGGDLNYYIEQADARTGFAVLVPTAADALLLADPKVPAQATLDNWQKELRVLFTVAGRNKARVCLIPLRNAVRSPAATMAAIGAYFNLDLPALAAQEPVVLNMPEDPLDRLVAHVFASDDKSVARVDARLLAKSLALPSDIPSVKDLLSKVKAELADRDQRVSEYALRLTERDDELKAARQEVKALADHIELIRTSTSWRLTGPMRRFRRLFRRS